MSYVINGNYVPIVLEMDQRLGALRDIESYHYLIKEVNIQMRFRDEPIVFCNESSTLVGSLLNSKFRKEVMDVK